MDDLFGAGLNDVGQHGLCNGTRLPSADAAHFKNFVLFRHRGSGAALLMLEAFGFWNGGSQTDRNVAREEFSTERNYNSVANGATMIDGDIAFTAADIDED